MIKSKAYIYGIEVDLDFAGVFHDVIAKTNLGIKLNLEEERFCYMINNLINECLKNDKKEK